MNKKNTATRQKLMRLVLITSGLVLFLTCTTFFAYEFYAFRQSAKDQLLTLGAIVSANSTTALAFQNHEDATEILHGLKAEKDIVAAALYDAHGHLFATYPQSASAATFPVYRNQTGYNYVNSHLQGFEPVIQGEKRVGTLFLKSDLKAIYHRINRYAISVLLIILASIAVAYLLSMSLQKKISAPILALAETAENISALKDYKVRAKKYDNDEVGSLTEAFNHMLEQIERQNAEIISFNHALEKKVIERTAELEVANNELMLKNELVERIIDSSVSVIAVFDRELNYLILNNYGREVYGVNEDVIGKNILQLFPQLRNSPMYSYLKEALKGEMKKSHYYKSWLSNRVLENFYIPLYNKGENVYAVLVIGHDITQIVRTNEKLKLVNKELEKSNFDLEQFAFVASHDLQEPLRKIQTFSYLIEKNIDDKELIKKHLSKVISSAGRMTDLIKAVLNYSRISNEKGHFGLVNLGEILENIKSDFELTIIEKQASIVSDDFPVIPGNEFQMNQLFLNLISNSLKFSDKQPEIKISCRVVRDDNSLESNSFNSKEYAEISFADNGIGFDEKYADKIFNVFQRLHTKQQYPGTGIGLALCKKIIDNHQGTISVSSKPGEGTIFVIRLPLTLTVVEDLDTAGKPGSSFKTI